MASRQATVRLIGIDAALDETTELFSGVLVDDNEQLQDLAVGGLIELEVESLT